MVNFETLMTPEEVSKKLSIARSTVYNFAHRGLLPAVKLGKSLRFRPEDLAKFLDDQAAGNLGKAA